MTTKHVANKQNEPKPVLCDCGCGGEVSPGAVERGWKFLRGHKPQGTLITKSKKLGTTRTLRLASSTTSPHLMAAYAREQAKTLRTSIEATERLLAKLEDMRQRAADWDRIADSIDQLTAK